MKGNKLWNKLNVYFFFKVLKHWNAQVDHTLNMYMLKPDFVLVFDNVRNILSIKTLIFRIFLVSVVFSVKVGCL